MPAAEQAVYRFTCVADRVSKGVVKRVCQVHAGRFVLVTGGMMIAQLPCERAANLQAVAVSRDAFYPYPVASIRLAVLVCHDDRAAAQS